MKPKEPASLRLRCTGTAVFFRSATITLCLSST
ncbi:Uncharacterised protein [Mycobacterium tuberculosis]|nr:Uncharacterised protein [Mycobacterium tuberculosis]